MLTAADLVGKHIPQEGVCPVCFDHDRHLTRIYKRLRTHLMKVHGLPPMTLEEKNRRHREFYAAHLDAYHAYQRAYRASHRAAGNAWQRNAWQRNNYREWQRAYRAAHRDAVNARMRVYMREYRRRKKEGGKKDIYS